MRQFYKENLILVLKDVAILINRLKGEIVVTAVHDDFLEEYELYDHPDDMKIREIARSTMVRNRFRYYDLMIDIVQIYKHEDNRDEYKGAVKIAISIIILRLMTEKNIQNTRQQYFYLRAKLISKGVIDVMMYMQYT